MSKTIEWCGKEIQNPENQQMIRKNILNPILRQVFIEIYPYMLLLFGILFILCVLVTMSFIMIVLQSFKMK